MTFAEIPVAPGHLVRVLTSMADSGRVPHALLFHEDDGGGATTLALAFLQYLFCRERTGGDSCGACPSCNKISKLIHPDVHFFFPTTSSSKACVQQWRQLVLSNPGFREDDLNTALGLQGKKSLINVQEAKEILSILSLSALEGGLKVIFIYLPEKMNTEASNRLLKILEEPPELTHFVLITHAPDKLLSTVLSRCLLLRVPPTAALQHPRSEEFDTLLSKLFSALADRNLPRTLKASEEMAALPSRDSVKTFCAYASYELRQMFLAQQNIGRLAPEEGGVGAGFAPKLKKTFPRMALTAFDRVLQLTERNVNQKIIFTELADTLFLAA